MCLTVKVKTIEFGLADTIASSRRIPSHPVAARCRTCRDDCRAEKKRDLESPEILSDKASGAIVLYEGQPRIETRNRTLCSVAAARRMARAQLFMKLTFVSSSNQARRVSVETPAVLNHPRLRFPHRDRSFFRPVGVSPAGCWLIRTCGTLGL